MGGRAYIGISRRQFVGTGIAAGAALAFGPGFWRSALADPAAPGQGPYGPLLPPDANGLMLPQGFSSRVIARAMEPVPGTAYPWHIFSDGQATFATEDGGWILVSNSESLAATGAGSSAIRFNPDGTIESAYRILAGTNSNCAGGPTPWGTWLSCEEHDGGHVWESDPAGVLPAVIRPAMGTFNHEAACIDPAHEQAYMTEDEGDGCLYRFTPASYPDLSSGLLEVALGDPDASLTWAPVPDPTGISGPTRDQVDGAARFDGGEGIWFDSGFVYFSTKGDDKIRAYDTATGTVEVVYDKAAHADAPLGGLDNVTVSRSGDLYVCEDGDDLDIGIITPERVAARFLKLTGADHDGSELAGVVFDPSGTRMYFSSQRGFGLGLIYEVSGPFRLPAAPPAPGPSGGAPEPAPPRTAEPQREPQRPAESGRRPEQGGRERTDANAPGLALRSQSRVSLRRLVRDGIAVKLTVDRPGRALIALRTSDLTRVPGARGSADRPKHVTLARKSVRFARAGNHTVTLRIGRRAARRLRGRRSVEARLSALGSAGGRKLVSTRRLRISGR